MIPSGYKEDTVFSAIPTDGSGDLSFTRASNGTRVNSAGLVEVCPWNLLEQSEDFTNAYWNKYQSVITANSTTAPNGTTTADKLEYTTTGTAVLFATSSALQNQVYALSCYGKQGTTNILQIGFTLSGGDKIANFNLNTGVISTTSSGVTASIESVGDGWYRCIMSLTTDINTPNVFINSTSGTTGQFIYIWGAQLNIGSTAKPYFPTTDRLNVPRLTYQNGGGGCPSLLLEKQSTNIIPYSETFENWTTGFSALTPNAVTANYGISPDGTQNADRIQLTVNASNVASQIYQFPSSSATTYTASVWLKSLSGTPTISIVDAYNITGGYQLVTLTTEWVRYTKTFAAGAGGILPQFLLYHGTTSSSADFLAWGFQVEQSSYPTSYIPTTSASATRVADACSKTGISSLIGQTEGVIFVEINRTQKSENYQPVISLQGASSAQLIELYFGSANTLILGIYNSGAQYQSASGVISNGTHKIAIAYKQNDFAYYIDGVQISTDNSGTVPALSQFALGTFTYTTGYELSDGIKQAVLFKTRLTNAELASLTTI
jgi:hypothetical protein